MICLTFITLYTIRYDFCKLYFFDLDFPPLCMCPYLKIYISFGFFKILFSSFFDTTKKKKKKSLDLYFIDSLIKLNSSIYRRVLGMKLLIDYKKQSSF